MTLPALLDRFDLLMDTPESVPKLRRFILQLAVRGRLSDRRASDEPVEMLLERMGDEKERLNAAGEYKYQKNMPTIEENDIPFNFSPPEEWTWIRFGNLGKVFGGGTPKKSNPEYWGGEIPWVSPKDMKEAVVQKTEDQITQKGLEESSAKLVPPGSLLIVGRSGILERKLPVAVTAVECTANQDLKVVAPLVSGMARYIRLMLKGFESYILDELVKTGTTVRSLKYTEFQLQPYPLPPIDEQQRIVETVDGLMDECDVLEQQQERERTLQVQIGTAATETLQSADSAEALRPAWERVREHFDTVTTTLEGVDALRQTILQLAVQGHLTECDSDDTAANELIRKSSAEIQELYDSGKITKPSERPPVREEEKVFDLPENWTWTRLGNVLALVNGRAYKKSELLDEGTPVIRIQNLTGDGSWYHTDLDLPPEKYCNSGDLLYTWSGTFGPHIWDGKKAVFHYHIWRIELTGALTKKFAYHLLQAISADVEEDAHGIMLPHMTKGGMEKHPIPLPPIGEQKRIVEALDGLFPLFDNLEDHLADSIKYGKKLMNLALEDVNLDSSAQVVARAAS